jgi:type IV pilus biogenesis protein CpaD/CtpE
MASRMTTDMTQTPMTKNHKYPVPDLVTKTTAARMIGVARQNVDGFIVRGELDTVSMAGQVFVTKESAERVSAERAAKKRAA